MSGYEAAGARVAVGAVGTTGWSEPQHSHALGRPVLRDHGVCVRRDERGRAGSHPSGHVGGAGPPRAPSLAPDGRPAGRDAVHAVRSTTASYHRLFAHRTYRAGARCAGAFLVFGRGGVPESLERGPPGHLAPRHDETGRAGGGCTSAVPPPGGIGRRLAPDRPLQAAQRAPAAPVLPDGGDRVGLIAPLAIAPCSPEDMVGVGSSSLAFYAVP